MQNIALNGNSGTILFTSPGDCICCLLNKFRGVSHGHTQTGLAQHGFIIAAVTQGHGRLYRDIQKFAQCFQRDSLLGIGVGDFHAGAG